MDGMAYTTVRANFAKGMDRQCPLCQVEHIITCIYA